MDWVKVRWLVDVLLGIDFLICLVTGLLKYTVLLQLTGLNEMILPAAFISDLHDWSGLVLAFLVFVHLILNRRWIIMTTRKMFSGSKPGDTNRH